MRLSVRVYAVLALAACSLTSVVKADAIPGADLKEKAKGTTALGDWSLAAFAGRNDFPFLAEKKDLEEIEGGRYALPNRGSGELTVANEKLVSFRSAGFQNNAEVDKWLAAVVFAPKEAGNYAVTGKATGMWCDLDKNQKNAVKWAVLRGKADGKKFKAIASGEGGEGDSADFSTVEKLKSIPMEAGETLVFTVFRPTHWGAAGGSLDGLNVDKSAAAPTPAKAEEKK